MNTTLTINLAGNAFYIDEDAYTTLKHYLENIEHNLGNDTDKKDVMHDIEARIAELFADMRRQRHVDVITLSMVKEVMAQLGRPDDFKEEPEGSAPVGEQKKGHHKKVYRDTQNKLIGGVCAGLGHWVGIDAIWVRLIFILCLLLWGITLPIYIVLWLIIPEAKSAAQRLDMRGEEPTVENIQKEVEEMKLRPENSGSGCLGTGLKIIVWLIAGFFLVIAATIFYALFAGAIALLPVGFIGIFFTHGSWATAMLSVFIVLVIGLPVFVLVYAIVKSIKPDSRLSPTVMWICLVLWLVAAAGSVGLGIYEIVTNEGIQEALIDPDGYELWDEDDEALTPSTLQLGAFHSVVVSGAGKITITQAEEQYVTTDAGKRKGFSAVVEDSTLTISMGKKGGKMWIQVPELKSIDVTGASTVNTQGTLSCEYLEITASGASKIDMRVEATAVNVDASGASKVELEGNTHRLKVSATGASKVDTKDMSADIVDAEASGASKIEVIATDSLRAEASSVSKIEYEGSPHVSVSKSSGGKVWHK